jgi:hypothetical protein
LGRLTKRLIRQDEGPPVDGNGFFGAHIQVDLTASSGVM